MKSNLKSGQQMLLELREPGKILIFVDETETSGKTISTLVPDFLLICGVEINSGGYAEVCKRMNSRLRELGGNIREFHATEIVNPGTASPWRQIPTDTRTACLSFLARILFNDCGKIYFCYIGKDQFESLMQANNITSLTQKSGLKKVFFNALLSEDFYKDQEIAIILDSDKALKDEIKIQQLNTKIKVHDNNIKIVSSEVESGLQLADFAAYLLNRSFHLEQRVIDGKIGPFDEVISEVLEKLSSKYRNLLKECTVI
jgi:hypothetical protein